LLKVGAVRWGLSVVALACACGALAPAAYASLGVPTGGSPSMITGSGTSTATAMAAFEAAAGGTDNGMTAGEQSGGYRHATWDQIALNGSDSGSTTIASGVITPARSRLQSWGLQLGPDIAVSDNGFQSVSSTPFTPFSAPNIWGPFNSDTAEFDVVAPAAPGATPQPAQTRGLGIVFLNPSASTQIAYYNGSILLGSVAAPTGPTTSFAGVLFPDAVVTRVVVTLGSAEIFAWNGTTPPTSGGAGSVAGDDIVLAEPGPKLQATAGVPISPVLDTVTESNASAHVSATIDWGDGTQTTGTIAPASGGSLGVSGSHAYALAGTYNAKVTVDDSDGTEQTSRTVIQVAARASTTSVTCTPSPVAVTASATCIATVADAGAGGPVTPTGTVELTSPTAGASFAADSGCMLGPTGTPGVAICEVQFTPTQLPPAQARIEGFYPGDDAHAASSGSAIIGVRAQRCTLKALSAKLKGHPPVFGMIVTCDARTNVTIAVKATGARQGRFKAFTLAFGSIKAAVTAGRPTVLTLRPSAGVLSALRTAGRRHQRVSLKLTLTATSHATRTTTTTRVAAFRIR
jgi:PKD domain